jgi:hypothetical protein
MGGKGFQLRKECINFPQASVGRCEKRSSAGQQLKLKQERGPVSAA